MANFEQWINQDLQDPVQAVYSQSLAFSSDNDSILVGVHVTDGGEPATLSGNVVAHVIRSADGGTVSFSGTLSGSDVSAILPEACFAYPGQIAVMLQLVSGTTKTTLCKALYSVVQGETGTPIDPGSVVPDLDDLLAMLDEMAQATDAAEAAAAAVPAIIAPTFSASAAYTAGSYVYYNGALYRFTADHAAGAWTGSDATSVQLAPEVADLKSAFTMVVNSELSLESGTFSDANGKTKVSNATRIRTTSPLDVGYFDTIVIADGYEAYIFLLDSSLGKIGTVAWSGKITKNVLSTASFINIAIRKKDATSADISGDVSAVIAGTQVFIKTDADIPDMKDDIGELQTDVTAIQTCFEDVPNNNKIIYDSIETDTTQSGSRVVYADIYLEKNKSYVFRFWYNGGWYVFGSTKCTIESNGSVVATLFSYDSIPNTGLAFTWTEDSGVYKIHTLSGQAIGWTVQTIADGLMVYESGLSNPTYVQGEAVTMAKDAERVGTMTASEIIAAAKQADTAYSLIAYGDSLTQGAGSSGVGHRYLDICKTELKAASDMPLGYGGSASLPIAFTAGAVSGYVPPNVREFALKYADLTTDINIALNQLNNKTVIIDGQEHTISQTGVAAYSLPETYTPSNLWLPVTVKNATLTADIYIIWIGTNDGGYQWDVIDAMIAKLPHSQYVVMGLTKLGTNTSIEDEQKAFRQYGSHFFNTRVQIVSNAFGVLDMTPTAEDTEAISVGLMPPSLLSDSTHFNDSGYEAIGKLLAIHIKSLGYAYRQ